MKLFTHKTFLVAAVLGVILGTLPTHAATRHRAELAFVANQSSNNVSAYQIKPNGGLLAVPGSPFSAGGSPNSVTVVPSGRFA